MPRAADIYQLPPGTTVEPNTTILSAWANGFSADVAATFNTEWPLALLPTITVAKGGTGAVTAIGGFDALVTKGADVATASTIDLDAAAGAFIDLTGTTTVTAVTLAAGHQRLTRAVGIFQITVGASLVGNNGGANVVTKAGDLIIWEGYAAGVVRFWVISQIPVQPSLGTPTASTSGTSVSFLTVPAGCKRITVNFRGVSTNGVSPLLIQMGVAAGIETTGYLGSAVDVIGAIAVNSTSGFQIGTNTNAGNIHHGSITLSLENSTSNSWCAGGFLANSNNGQAYLTGGSKSLAGVCDRIRITTVGGVDTFDAGEINVIYN